MKVVYSVATKLGGGGIGTTAFNAVKGIYQAGMLQKVYCTINGQNVIPSSIVAATNVGFFERLGFLPSYYQWLLKDVFHDLIVTTSLYSNVVKPLDIFHVWNGHGLYSMRKARKLGAKIVVERASSHPLTYEGIMNEELRIRGIKPQKLLGINKKRLLAELTEADFITVPSDFSYQSMLENGVPEEKLAKLPFGVNLDFFRPNPSNVQRSTFNVLFVGQVGFRKGVLYLLEAWKKLGLKDAKLRILGQEDAEIQPSLAPFRNDPSIEFLGYGNSLDLYQSSDVFVLPSLEEGSALVTYEALACGLPSIVSFESGSIVEDGKQGFVIPSRSANALAEKLSYLFGEVGVRQRMSVSARQKAKEFPWEKYGQSLAHFYSGLNLG